MHDIESRIPSFKWEGDKLVAGLMIETGEPYQFLLPHKDKSLEQIREIINERNEKIQRLTSDIP